MRENMTKRSDSFRHLYKHMYTCGNQARPAAAARSKHAREETLSSEWILPIIIALVVFWGMARGTPVYDSFVRGAGKGIKTAVSVLPCLAAVIVAVETR
jgi:hypothetical protein